MYILSKLILLESLGLVPIGGGGGLCSHEDLREGERREEHVHMKTSEKVRGERDMFT